MSASMMRKLGVAMLLALMLGGVAACQDDAGPAEEAGQDIDDAMEDAGEGMEEMGEDIQDTADGN